MKSGEAGSPLLIFKGLCNPWLEHSQRQLSIINKTTQWKEGAEEAFHTLPGTGLCENQTHQARQEKGNQETGRVRPCQPPPQSASKEAGGKADFRKGKDYRNHLLLSLWPRRELARAALQRQP